MEEIKVGDVVKLQSGGPKMTVGWIDEDGVAVSYFVDGKIHHSKFPATSLVKVED